MPSIGGYDINVDQLPVAADGFFGTYYRCTYDFTVAGGAVSTIILGPSVPANTVIIDGHFDVTVVGVGAGNSIALGLENQTNDLLATVAVGTWGTLGRHAIVPVDTAATSIKTTLPRQLALVISGGAITAGKFFLFLRCYQSGV